MAVVTIAALAATLLAAASAQADDHRPNTLFPKAHDERCAPPSITESGTIVGTVGNDTIDAGGGNNTVYAVAGTDVVCGNRGDDKLFGGDGSDSLYGGNGNDTLFGMFG